VAVLPPVRVICSIPQLPHCLVEPLCAVNVAEQVPGPFCCVCEIRNRVGVAARFFSEFGSWLVVVFGHESTWAVGAVRALGTFDAEKIKVKGDVVGT
jgi:hypothetical protein